MKIIEPAAGLPTPAELARWLLPTPLLDHDGVDIQALISRPAWSQLSPFECVGAAYDFVRDEIAFGYNSSDDLPASVVLSDSIGQCNTKGVLLMALLRGLGIPCRFHGFTIDKKLQRGAITGLAYLLAPRNIIHSWIEVWLDQRWVRLEGFILDRTYLQALQRRFGAHRGAFCGFGAATPDLQRPPVDWQGTDTFIQKDGINADFGIFDSPDDVFASHGVNLRGLKRVIFQRVIRHQMNRNVARVRGALDVSSAANR